MPAVRLTDVAARAGVSLATASRVINGSQRVPTAAIAARVRAAAAELGYVANAQAQALARSATGMIGVVVHDIADPYFSSIVRGVQRRAREHHSQVLLAGTDRHEQTELDAVMAFAAYRTDAIILVGSRGAHSDAALHRTLARYLENSGRVVAFGSAGPPGARLLELGNREGSRRLAEALIDRGVRRFAILGGPPDLVTSRDRVAGFQQAINGRRLRAAPVVHGDFTSEGGHAAARAAWDLLDHHRGSCLLAVNDVMALGAITALRSNGLRVPDDVQVAGFDDIPTLRDHDPPLTTFRLPLEAIGEQAAALALSSDGTTHLRIDGEVVLRASAGRADS